MKDMLFALSVLVGVASAATGKSVVAKFGESGGFVYIDPANGKYQFKVDYAALNTATENGYDILGDKCVASDLKYHIHAKWDNIDGLSAVGADCGAANAGGHYDPTLACGGASEAKAGDCVAKMALDANRSCRDSAGAVDATCSTGDKTTCSGLTDSLYSLACVWDFYYGNDEIGDLSGKFGKAKGDGKDHTQADASLKDYDFVGMSVVFHCGSKTGANAKDSADLDRAFCAKFVDAETAKFTPPDDSASPAAGLLIGAATMVAAFMGL